MAVNQNNNTGGVTGVQQYITVGIMLSPYPVRGNQCVRSIPDSQLHWEVGLHRDSVSLSFAGAGLYLYTWLEKLLILQCSRNVFHGSPPRWLGGIIFNANSMTAW